MITKAIGGYEGLYWITNNGEVYNKYGIMHPQTNEDGYLRIRLSKNDIRKSYFIHVLVARNFIPNPNNKPRVNHKDSNRQNNNDWNLEWATHSEDVLHSYRKGLRRPHPRNGVKNPAHKLTEDQVNQIREYYCEGVTVTKIAEIFHISQSTISNIIARKTWRHI